MNCDSVDLKMFQFDATQPEIIIHCDVSVCACLPVCSCPVSNSKHSRFRFRFFHLVFDSKNRDVHLVSFVRNIYFDSHLARLPNDDDDIDDDRLKCCYLKYSFSKTLNSQPPPPPSPAEAEAVRNRLRNKK